MAGRVARRLAAGKSKPTLATVLVRNPGDLATYVASKQKAPLGLGRYNIVGMPMALLLIRGNATTTVCHSRTKDLAAVIRRADILIAAIGKAEMVGGDWIKPGAAVIDVGINSKPDASKKSGYRLVGDVNFDE